jgi:hypothetical protein
MHSSYKLALAVIAGAAIGAAAVEGLHAQAKPAMRAGWVLYTAKPILPLRQRADLLPTESRELRNFKFGAIS